MHRILFSMFVAVFFVFATTDVKAQSGSFGTSIALDGDELIVGEPNTSFREGSVYVYAHGANG